MVFVDSNIWCYYFDGSADEHEEVCEKVDELIEGSRDIHLNTVVLMEVAHFLVKNLGGKEGTEKMGKMLEYNFNVTGLDFPMTRRSLRILEEKHQTGIGGRDSTVIASMNEAGVETLVTHDQAFKKIDSIGVEDPVTE